MSTSQSSSPDTRPAYGRPEYDARDQYTPYAEQEPAAVRWDLAFGCALSFGAAENGGPLRVDLHLSDREKQQGMCVRTVTPQQVRAYAHYLLRLVAEETGPIRCRTDGILGHHDPATVLVNGDPRCDSCVRAIEAGGGPVEKSPLPGSVAA